VLTTESNYIHPEFGGSLLNSHGKHLCKQGRGMLSLGGPAMLLAACGLNVLQQEKKENGKS